MACHQEQETEDATLIWHAPREPGPQLATLSGNGGQSCFREADRGVSGDCLDCTKQGREEGIKKDSAVSHVTFEWHCAQDTWQNVVSLSAL